MKNIIEKLFDLHISSNAFPFGELDKERIKSEWELYDFLYENLSDETKKAFCDYIIIRGKRERMELKSAYECGFKTAINFIIETLQK